MVSVVSTQFSKQVTRTHQEMR